MAINDEIIRLVLDLTKSAGSEETLNSLKKLRASVVEAAETYEVLERQVGEYEVLQRQVAATQNMVVTTIDKEVQFYRNLIPTVGLLNVRTDELGGSMGRLTGQNRMGGQGILGASYAVQDFTSQLGNSGLAGGLRAVQNNIPQILMGLGAGAGLTGILSVLAVGLGLVIDNWEKIATLWGKGKTKEEADRMEKLAEATKKAADEGERLLRTQNPEQIQHAGVVKRAVEAFGGKEVQDAVEKAIIRQYGPAGDTKQLAKNLLTNVSTGNVKAEQMLHDIMLPGFGNREIADVLLGGKTPAELAANRKRLQDQQIADREKLDQEKKQAKAKLDQEVKEAEEDARQGAEEIQEAQKGSAEKARQEARRISNQVKAGADAQRQQQFQQIDTDKLRPHIDPNQAANQLEFNQIMLENDAIDIANSAILSRQIAQAKTMQVELRNPSNPIVGQP